MGRIKNKQLSQTQTPVKMMKSLAILAATLVAAQASQDAGPGLGRLLKGNQNGIVNKQEEEDCTEEDCGRRLKDENNYMLNDNDDEMDSKWCQENPEDCGARRLNDAQDKAWAEAGEWISVFDTDGNGKVEWEEFRDKLVDFKGLDWHDVSELFF